MTWCAIDPGDFPTDRYVVEGIAAADGLTVRPGFDELDDVAVVVRSMIDYRSAEIVDIAAETARATEAGALVIWDLSHAAGVHPVGLARCRRPARRGLHVQVPQRRTRLTGLLVRRTRD